MGQRGPSKNDESIEGGKETAKEKRDKKLAREKKRKEAKEKMKQKGWKNAKGQPKITTWLRGEETKERGKEWDESEDGMSKREGVRWTESPEGRHEVMM